MGDSARHIACTSCRERKVKCDGVQPTCQRCSRYGAQCVYTPPPKQTKVDVSSVLTTINNRLLQAETALAAHQGGPSRTYPQGIPPQVFDSTEAANLASVIPIHDTLLGSEINSLLLPPGDFPTGTVDSGHNGIVAANLSLNDFAVWNDADAFTMDTSDEAGIGHVFGPDEDLAGALSQHSTKDALNHDWLGDNPSVAELTPAATTRSSSSHAYDPVLETGMNDLDQCYFETIHRFFPMMDKVKFASRMNELHVAPELLGLRYAMWAHAGALLPMDSKSTERFYQQARECLEHLEIEGSGRSTTITALQINVLIALYELNRTLFTRAWVSVSRAVWLARMLELHKMDQKSSSGRRHSPQTLLPTSTDPADLEERRRTLWAVFSLNCFVGVGVGWNTGSVMDYAEITTLIPVHDACDSISSTTLTVDDSLKLFATWVLSPYQGVVIAATLCASCLSHVKQLHRESMLDHSSYDFWVQHHRLDETINYISTSSSAHLTPANFMTEPNVLLLNLIIQATTICLHQAVIAQAKKIKTSTVQISKSENISMKAAIEISTLLRFGGRVNLVKMNHFTPWAIYVTLQALVRRSQSKDVLSRQPSIPATHHHLPRSNHHPHTSRPGSSPGNGSDAQDDPWIDARALDSMHSLLSTLADMKGTSPLAGIFDDQINEELAGGEATTRDRIVGLVTFPLTHPSARSRDDSNNIDVLYHL